jgi:phosphomannomutase
MKVNPSIFKSYDIRGIYPKELNEEAVFKVGRAFVNYTGAERVVVGMDMRISSSALYANLVKGIMSQGADVYNIGEVPVELMYFSAVHFDYDAGIMITASHNPKEYNGLKMIKRKTKGIFDVVRGKDLIELSSQDFEDAEKLGEIKDLNVWQEYISHIFSIIPPREINPAKVVIDAGNGMAGKVIPMIGENLPIEIIPLNFDLDGNFPNHPPNPLLEESTKQIKEKVLEQKADFGVIFDGDADRIFLIDERGEFVRGDISLLFLADYFLKKFPGKAVAYNLICSKAVPEFIKKMGGIPVRTQVGYVNVTRGLIENKGILAGEISGHYSFRDNYYFDSGITAFLVFLKVIGDSNEKLSEMVKKYFIYEISAEINFEVDDKKRIIEKAKEKYSDGRQDFLDGITVGYKDWWFNLRPSNTEPLLRLTIEADTKELLEKKKKELSSFIRKLT